MPTNNRSYKRRNKRKYRKKRGNHTPIPMTQGMTPKYNVILHRRPFEIENDATIETRGVINFKLSDFLGDGNWTSISDYYRINWIECKFIPIMTEVQNRPYDDTTTANIANIIPSMYTSIDRDSEVAPSSITAIQIRNHKVTKATKPIYYKFTPNRLNMVYRTSTTTGYTIDTNSHNFIDCANTDVPHFGIKYGLETASPNRGFVYSVEIKASITFCGKRG